MAYTSLLRLFIFSAALFVSVHMTYNIAYAEVNQNIDNAPVSKQKEAYLLDKNMIDIIDKYSLRKKTDKNNIQTATNQNLSTYSADKINHSPQYLNNSILSKSNIALLEKILPSEYSILDMPKRDNSPINRLGASSNMNKYPEYGNTFTGVANILLDVVFGTLTRNTLSMNINRIENNDSISLSITPVKGLALKVGLEDYLQKSDKSIFEVKYKYSNATNIKLKTSESSSETKAGVEFEISF